MDAAGQRGFLQHRVGNLHAHPPEADFLRRLADAEHGESFAGDEGLLTQSFQGVAFAMEGGDHAEAGGTAVHGVVLVVVGEGFHGLMI